MLAGHPRLPQLRIPTGQVLLQLRQSRLQLLTQGLQFLVVLTLLGSHGLFVVALLVSLAAPKRLEIAGAGLQLPLLLGIGLNGAFHGLLDLMQLL